MYKSQCATLIVHIITPNSASPRIFGDGYDGPELPPMKNLTELRGKDLAEIIGIIFHQTPCPVRLTVSLFQTNSEKHSK